MTADRFTSDQVLVRDVKNGDQDAARKLFERYSGQLHRLAEKGIAGDLSCRLDADDITQSVFRTFFRRVADGQYEVPHGDSIWKLLSVIALNKIRFQGRHHRAAKRDISRSSRVEEMTEIGPTVVNDEEALRILHLTIVELMSSLSETQQRIIQSRIDGLDISAISTTVGCSKRTVERVLQRFRADLQSIIDEDEPEA